ncbi:hypothetical protein [Bradyrhizobium sp. URHD0069]|uniref:hypothetical protein n=1 Tax=Bradyrhizobium sp. URHD0069 TaxID=1380355 RepID=UPI0012DF4EEB|nr:hypothetical protein [Bradyrhizobium sp. URHD0069]
MRAIFPADCLAARDSQLPGAVDHFAAILNVLSIQAPSFTRWPSSLLSLARLKPQTGLPKILEQRRWCRESVVHSAARAGGKLARSAPRRARRSAFEAE